MIPESHTHNGNGLMKPPENNTFELKQVIKRMLGSWYWIMLAVVVSLCLAFTYIRYTLPLYEIRSMILMEEGGTNSPVSVLYGQIPGLAQDRGEYGNLANHVAIMTSSPIISRTLTGLDFEISYYSIGRFGETELYQDLPFQILWDKNHPQITGTDFLLSIDPDKNITLSLADNDINIHDYTSAQMVNYLPEYAFHRVIKPETKIETKEFSFIVVLNQEYNNPTGDYKFRFNTHQSLVNEYKTALMVLLDENFASILNLSLKSHHIQKGSDFLEKLAKVYLDTNLEKKNQYAELTIQFIDSQLQAISDSLNISEGRLETFRSSNQMIDFSAQSQQLLTQINELDNQMIQQRNQNEYYNYLQDYIESNHEMETVIAPSSIGIDDPLLNSFIIQLNNLINQKSSQTSIRPNSEHPTIVQLNTQIEIVKNSLRQSINNIIKQSNIELENLNRRMREYNEQIRLLPATERNFVNFERKYNIDSQTYTFLLQKLSEARIAKASSIPDGQILETPFVSALVNPQKERIFVLAFLLGLIFPVSIILLKDFFNDKITSQEDVALLTPYPVIGSIYREGKKILSQTPVLDKPNSPLSSSYVSVRTQIRMLTKGKEHPAIAVTSSLPGEGKTFNSINIASSLSLTRKKVVILDLDVRNSRISEVFNLDHPKGVVNFIIGNASQEEITYDTKLAWLKVIPAGPIPPNPAEMLSDTRLQLLIKKLKGTYDFVIIDTPPTGLFADLFQLEDVIDATIFVVKHKSTQKQTFKMVLREISKHHIRGIGIVINNIHVKKSKTGYGYGYGYGYRYGPDNVSGKNKKSLKRDHLTLEDLAPKI